MKSWFTTKLRFPSPYACKMVGLLVSKPWWSMFMWWEPVPSLTLEIGFSCTVCARDAWSALDSRPSSLASSVTVFSKKHLIPLLIFPKLLLQLLNLTEFLLMRRYLSRLTILPLQIWQVQQVLVRMSWTIERVFISRFPIRVFYREIRQSFLQLKHEEFRLSKVLYSRQIWHDFPPRFWCRLSIAVAASRLCVVFHYQFSFYSAFGLAVAFFFSEFSRLLCCLAKDPAMSLSLLGWLIFSSRSSLVILYWYSSMMCGNSFFVLERQQCELTGREAGVARGCDFYLFYSGPAPLKQDRYSSLCIETIFRNRNNHRPYYLFAKYYLPTLEALLDPLKTLLRGQFRSQFLL